MALYADHGTHEQFHSEFKTDMDLTRLPSGKFDTNYLVCQLAAVAMNILRLIGQQGLRTPARRDVRSQNLAGKPSDQRSPRRSRCSTRQVQVAAWTTA